MLLYGKKKLVMITAGYMKYICIRLAIWLLQGITVNLERNHSMTRRKSSVKIQRQIFWTEKFCLRRTGMGLRSGTGQRYFLVSWFVNSIMLNSKVRSWVDLLTKFINLAYDLHTVIFSDLAAEDYSILNADKTYITNDERKLRKAKQIDNSGIFF